MSDYDNETPEFLAKYAVFPIGAILTIRAEHVALRYPGFLPGTRVKVIKHVGHYTSNGVLDSVSYDVVDVKDKTKEHFVTDWEVWP